MKYLTVFVFVLLESCRDGVKTQVRVLPRLDLHHVKVWFKLKEDGSKLVTDVLPQ